MKILHTVTVTGADDSIKPDELIAIQNEYPFAEFGILLNERSTMGNGNTRFPSKSWLKQLMRIIKSGGRLRLSGHICGRWVHGFLSGHLLDFDRIAPGLGEAFGRFQINTHAEVHFHDDAMYGVIIYLAAKHKTVIFQLDDADGTSIAKEVVENGHENIAGLFDLSHGAGILPDKWPCPIPSLSCGYAGGLSPETWRVSFQKLNRPRTEIRGSTRRQNFLATASVALTLIGLSLFSKLQSHG